MDPLAGLIPPPEFDGTRMVSGLVSMVLTASAAASVEAPASQDRPVGGSESPQVPSERGREPQPTLKGASVSPRGKWKQAPVMQAKPELAPEGQKRSVGGSESPQASSGQGPERQPVCVGVSENPRGKSKQAPAQQDASEQAAVRQQRTVGGSESQQVPTGIKSDVHAHYSVIVGGGYCMKCAGSIPPHVF